MVDYSELARASAANPLRQPETAKPIWIFGAGGFGRSLCRSLLNAGFEVAGFIEDPRVNSEVLGLPVLDWSTMSSKVPGAQVALGIFSHQVPFANLSDIHEAAGFTGMLMPWDIYDVLHEELGWRYWLSRRELLLAHIDRIENVACRLADDESRRLLYRLIAFRLGLDIGYSSFLSTEPRYFNELTSRPGPITYIDCGAYNGDTYEDLLAQPGTDCRRAFLLEPDPSNFNTLVQNMKARDRDVVCLPLGAAASYSIFSFASGDGAGSSIASEGDIHIASVGLDQLLPQSDADLIKLDVEGSEAAVLRGCQSMIARCRPSLMVSYYHNPEDLWELPELLFDLCEDYRYYLRQHQYNTFDSVLYAIPKGR